MSNFYTLHKGIFRDIKEVDVLIDLIESQQSTITELEARLKEKYDPENHYEYYLPPEQRG